VPGEWDILELQAVAVTKFEELIAWQKARELTRAIYQATELSPFERDQALINQIRCAAISVMSNIAEGFDREGPADFHRFLVIAKASCAEVRSQLYIALDVGYLDAAQFDELMALVNETGRVLNGLRLSIKRKL
jgi:four helix bundle protein